MQTIRRPITRSYGRWHPHVSACPENKLIRGGALALAPMYGPAGLVGPVGSTDHPFVGMDPSDPVTWVRPYNPQGGMIAYLNFDGAVVNDTQTVKARYRRKGAR